MNTTTPNPSDSDQETEAVYTLDVIAELAGTTRQTVLHYQEIGLITADASTFDTECLRRLRRIEHLRSTCEMNAAGLKMLLELLDEVEQLREERRRSRLS